MVSANSGTVSINGVETGKATSIFSWDWGDGKVTQSYFPATHTFNNTTKNYIVAVTSHYTDGTSASVQVLVRFVAPVINPISLPDNVGVTIPSSPMTLVSRMPGYGISSSLTVFDDSYFIAFPRPVAEYIFTVAASIEKDLANDNIYQNNGKFNQVVLRDPNMAGMYSLWYTNPVALGAGTYAFQGTFDWSDFMHEMGHNFTLNSPANYCFGGKIDGHANEIFSETMAGIFQHAAAYCLINNYATYGLGEDVAFEIAQSALNVMKNTRAAYDNYLADGMLFTSWDVQSTTTNELGNTIGTLVYKFFEHAENGSTGCKVPLKRMMTLLQTFDSTMSAQYDQADNTDAAATFRSTLIVAALSYAFESDLRSEFKSLNFPISDTVYNDLYQKTDTRST
jgi:hypothetical protein